MLVDVLVLGARPTPDTVATEPMPWLATVSVTFQLIVSWPPALPVLVIVPPTGKVLPDEHRTAGRGRRVSVSSDRDGTANRVDLDRIRSEVNRARRRVSYASAASGSGETTRRSTGVDRGHAVVGAYCRSRTVQLPLASVRSDIGLNKACQLRRCSGRRRPSRSSTSGRSTTACWCHPGGSQGERNLTDLRSQSRTHIDRGISRVGPRTAPPTA